MYRDPVGPVPTVEPALSFDEAGGDVEAPVQQALEAKVHTCTTISTLQISQRISYYRF
jgi:hypothetical protein